MRYKSRRSLRHPGIEPWNLLTWINTGIRGKTPTGLGDLLGTAARLKSQKEPFLEPCLGQEESREGLADWASQSLAHIAVLVESGLGKSGVQLGELAALPAALPEG